MRNRYQLPTRNKTPVARLAETPSPDSLPYCTIPGCGRPTRRAAGQGLNRFRCRYHDQALSRHGSAWLKTFTNADLRPYRRAAESYLKTHRADPWIAHSLGAIDGLLHAAGPHERVVDTLRMKPVDKARAALARLRHREIPPERILTIAIAIAAAVKEGPNPGGEPHEYRRCQIAKACIRQASGYHGPGAPGIKSYHRYPRSTGLLLRHLGRMVEEAADWSLHHHLDPVLDLKRARYGPAQAPTPSPRP